MASPSASVSPGRVLGRYQLLVPVAAGGMGMVWAARLRGTRGFQKIVAIKTLLPSMATDPEFERMFLDEAGVASRIRHPNVVEVLDLGEQNGVLYQVMEWVDGETLRSLMKASAKQGALVPTVIAVRILMQACAGLHAAHNSKDEKGHLTELVHRDVSPQNIMVTRGGVAKVADFGIAKLAKHGAQTDASIIKGKVAYMAPEQITGSALDRRADVFALGTILYELTTGKHPFRSENDVATASKICTEDRVPPSAIVPDYPPALERVVLKAIEKNANDRYATANELLRALDQALPESSRAGMDDEIATWFATLGADHKAEAIAEAARAADEAESSDVDFGETAMLSEMQVFQTDHPTGTDPSLRSLDATSMAQPAPPKARAWTAAAFGAFAALGLVGLVAIVLVLKAGSKPATAAAPSASLASTAPIAASASTEPSAKPASPTPSVVSSASATSAATIATPTRRPSGKPTGPATKPGTNTSGGFASPVTNPGF